MKRPAFAVQALQPAPEADARRKGRSDSGLLIRARRASKGEDAALRNLTRDEQFAAGKFSP